MTTSADPRPGSTVWSFFLGLVIAAGLAAFVGPMARPAAAHDPATYVPSRWKASSNLSFSFTSSFPGGAYRDRVVNGWSAWNARNQMVYFTPGADVADYDPNVCPSPARNGVHWKNLPDSASFDTYGLTVACGAGGVLSSAQVILDSDQGWYVGTGQPPPNQVDLWSTATHEFGHAAGLIHFDPNDTSICGVNDAAETMCAIYGPGLTGARTLGPHDIHTFEAAYGPTLYMSNNVTGTTTAGPPFAYGNKGDQFLACDWDGNGTDTISVYRNGMFFVRNSNDAGGGWPVPYGVPGDIAVCGDWNGDGIDTIGVYRNGTFFLSNSNASNTADVVFNYGIAGDRPIVGHWTAGGGTRDTVGIVRNGAYYLRNSNTTGVADKAFSYGLGTDEVLVGDWNGDGVTTPAVKRGGTWYLRDTNSTGVADITFGYGTAADLPLAANWTGQVSKIDSPGVVRGS